MLSRSNVLSPVEFTHQVFSGCGWENQVKSFIASLDSSDGVIWHRKREHKKIYEELTSLGYYVKYHYGEDSSISFKLNKKEGKADGWIFKNGKEIESVQIAIAFYDREEADIHYRVMNGEKANISGWVSERLSLLEDRVERRVSKKSNMKYQDIDTLIVGVGDFFVRRLNTDFLDRKVLLQKRIESLLSISNFRHAAIVDSDFVGKGECLIIPNKATQTLEHFKEVL